MSSEDLEKEVLDEKQGSILLGLISQLRKGSDLHRVTLPTFVLEPRSMLERISDFVSHPELILTTSTKDDSVMRFLDVVRYFLSIWHVRPKGVKKPYNPVLGEMFRCSWNFDNGTEGFYICEQVSHHPPISAYVFSSPENKVLISGEVRPTSKFLGNSAATIMGGNSTIQFTNRPEEKYEISYPNIYARGILFGTMYMEMGDTATISCSKSNLVCELEFKVKGFFTGTYNGISGKIKDVSTGEVLFNISGKWSDTIYIQKPTWPNKDVFFSVEESNIQEKTVPDEADMNEFESRLLWSKVTQAIIDRDMDVATEEKTLIEDNQRLVEKQRTKGGKVWENQFFVRPEGEETWKLRCELPMDDPETAKRDIKQFIFSPPRLTQYGRFWVSKENIEDEGEEAVAQE